MSIDEKAYKSLTSVSYKIGLPMCNVRQIIEAYEAAKASGQPVEATKYWLLQAQEIASHELNTLPMDSPQRSAFVRIYMAVQEAIVATDNSPKRESSSPILSANWQPIETAPKDGTIILVIIPYDPKKFTLQECVDIAHWEPISEEEKEIPSIPYEGKERGGCFRFHGDDGPFDIQPTHWQPLPDTTGIEDVKP